MHFLPAIFAIASVLQVAITQDMAAGRNSTVQDPSARDNSTVTATFTDGFDTTPPGCRGIAFVNCEGGGPLVRHCQKTVHYMFQHPGMEFVGNPSGSGCQSFIHHDGCTATMCQRDTFRNPEIAHGKCFGYYLKTLIDNCGKGGFTARVAGYTHVPQGDGNYLNFELV